MLAEMRVHAALEPRHVRLRIHREEEGLRKNRCIFQTPFGYRRTAELFRPEGEGPFSASCSISTGMSRLDRIPTAASSSRKRASWLGPRRHLPDGRDALVRPGFLRQAHAGR